MIWIKPTMDISMDWFKGKCTGKSHDVNGKIYEHLWYPVEMCL
jgi:hypothetical protein